MNVIRVVINFIEELGIICSRENNSHKYTEIAYSGKSYRWIRATIFISSDHSSTIFKSLKYKMLDYVEFVA